MKKPNSKLNSSIFFNYLCKKGVVDQSYFESEDIFDDRPIEEIENVYKNDTIESFAIHDDIENFKSLFSEDKYTTHDLKEGYTLTSLAALYGAKEVFKFLVYQREHEISEDLAIYATKGGDFDIISICQQNNLDFSNCLKYAIEYNRMNVAKWIIECFGVNFEAGIAASVIYFNTPFLAFFLLNYFGVNEFYNNTTPLMFAAKVGNLEMVKFIKEHDAVMDLRDDFNRTALHIAILENNVVIAKYLVDNGSNINMIEKSSISPLMCAVRAQSIEIASFLLQKGCDVNEQDCTEMTSLLYACETGNLAIIKLLVEHKSDIMMCNIFGCYPIHIAAMNGHVDAIKYLIEIGQRIDVKDKEGRTPIFYSVENNFYEVTEYLISEGSHTNLKNNKEKKLISFAKSDEMKQLLMKHMSSRTCYIY